MWDKIQNLLHPKTNPIPNKAKIATPTPIPNKYAQLKAQIDRGMVKYGSPPIATMSAELAKAGEGLPDPLLPTILTMKETSGLRYKPAQIANNPAGIGPGIKYPDLKTGIIGGGGKLGLKGVLNSAPYALYRKTGNLRDFFTKYTPATDPRNASYDEQIKTVNDLKSYFK